VTAFLTELFSLDGRVAIVTGGSSGIGEAMASALAFAGAQVVIVARDPTRLSAASKSLRDAGCSVAWVSADLSDRAEVGRGASAAAAAFGEPDILVNCAGVNLRPPLPRLTEEHWDLMFAVNVNAPFLLGQRFGPPMAARGWGRIINVTSQQAERAFGSSGGYGASKGSLAALTRSQSEAWAASGVCVNSVCPGFVTRSGRPPWPRARTSAATASPPTSPASRSSSRRPPATTSPARPSTSTAASPPGRPALREAIADIERGDYSLLVVTESRSLDRREDLDAQAKDTTYRGLAMVRDNRALHGKTPIFWESHGTRHHKQAYCAEPAVVADIYERVTAGESLRSIGRVHAGANGGKTLYPQNITRLIRFEANHTGVIQCSYLPGGDRDVGARGDPGRGLGAVVAREPAP
jgi:NAD(P)-dependent dehydrogenase (short-subunit alcohol dehydrogenase family)